MLLKILDKGVSDTFGEISVTFLGLFSGKREYVRTFQIKVSNFIPEVLVTPLLEKCYVHILFGKRK